MNYLESAAIVIASAGVAALASYLVAGRIKLDVRRRHHEVGSAIFLQLGVIYAVLLAFVFSEAWTEYNTAAQAINSECGDLHGSAMLAHTLPPDQAAPVIRAIAGYVSAVVVEEWPRMAQRQNSAIARDDLLAAMQVTANLDAVNGQQAAIRDHILSLLTDAHAQRETRLFQMTNGIPVFLWALLVIYAFVLIAFVLFAGVDFVVSQAALTAVFAGCTVLILVMIRLLDYPFEGALALPSTDFQETLVRVTELIVPSAQP
jgi:hypothetical protein